RVLRYILNYKMLFMIAIFCSLVYASMNGFSVYLIGPFLNQIFQSEEVIEQNPEQNDDMGKLENIQFFLKKKVNDILGSGSHRNVLTRLCVLIIIIVFLKNFFSYMQGYIMAFVEQGVIRNLREDLYSSYHRLPLRFFQKRKTGEMISRVLNDCNTINSNLNSSLINLMKEPINILVILFLMIIISWELTLFTFLVAPVSLFIISKIGKKLRKRTIRTQDRIADVTSVLEETISGIRVVKAFAMEKFEIARFKKANYSYFRSLLKLFRMRRLSPPITEFLGVSMAVAVLWIGGLLVLEKNWLEPGAFLQFLILMFVLMQSAKRLSEVNVKIQVGVAASERVFAIIDQPSDIVDPPNPIPLEKLSESIHLKNVSFEYDPGVEVLSDINIDIKVGENIAIIGPSGGGKSTLVDLLPRLIDPLAGSVEIDGHDIREYKLEDLRSLYGIVTQENILFNDTIRANIAYGRPDIKEENIIAAAKTANAHDFIESFEDGYDSIIGDRGTKLSGGQKQRLVIARAVLKNPPILIFDEATSALDSKAESEVQAAISKLMEGRTSFLIAHRLSTIQSASRIIVIDHGRIVEEGNHKELYDAGKLYRKLYDLQFTNVNGSM
ncbi:ABC transporter ATP-binding protein, partial [Candidatus Latescibacterota bacterium]